ncbi:MAG: PIN domain-containing protein [Burkholderiales bacterium]|nr:MAG: PIN domain-containing protein [Burkholderiales bacterium]
MPIAVDTHVLVRLLVRDDEGQFQAARQLVEQAAAAQEDILILLGVALEIEWVLRSRYRLDKPAIAGAFARLLETQGVAFEHEATLEETLYLWGQNPGADFADCLHVARALHLGCSGFATFDTAAARLPGGELLSAAS